MKTAQRADLVYVLTDRLRSVYWPRFCQYTLREVLASESRSEYGHVERMVDPAWHAGRVRYFYEEFVAGRWLKVDPIDVESEAYATDLSGPISWGGPFIVDGHHRFAAAVLARAPRIKASVGGLVSTRTWLTGRRRMAPPEVAECLL